jgi:hypothetical protein
VFAHSLAPGSRPGGPAGVSDAGLAALAAVHQGLLSVTLVGLPLVSCALTWIVLNTCLGVDHVRHMILSCQTVGAPRVRRRAVQVQMRAPRACCQAKHGGTA